MPLRHVQYATVIEQSAFLNSTFGLELLQLWTGFTVEMIEAIVGRNSKGKRKGQLKGQLVWEKVTIGGWSHLHGGVLYPGSIMNARIVDPWNGTVLFDVDMVRESSGPIEIKPPAPTLEDVAFDKLCDEIAGVEDFINNNLAELSPIHVETLKKALAERKQKAIDMYKEYKRSL